jgi:hypothetical protein
MANALENRTGDGGYLHDAKTIQFRGRGNWVDEKRIVLSVAEMAEKLRTDKVHEKLDKVFGQRMLADTSASGGAYKEADVNRRTDGRRALGAYMTFRGMLGIRRPRGHR